ncbi:MAG: hypothetical protein WAM14_21775 [Candidatus Nitrosopolaris sp.]
MQDTKLAKKLTTPEELSGLLNLALTGLDQLMDAGGFHGKDTKQIQKDYEENTNDVNVFLHQECIIDITNEKYYTLATNLYAAYVNFCKRRGTRSIHTNVFGRKLSAQGIYNRRHQEDKSREAYYDGVVLKQGMRGLNQELFILIN